MTDARDLIQRLVDALEAADWHTYSGVIAEARAYLEETFPVTVKEQRPDHLAVGDVWEFETEMKIKGKRKPQIVTVRAEVKGFHPGECAWQLQSLDGQHYFYLWEHAPQYEEMTYIGAIKNG